MAKAKAKATPAAAAEVEELREQLEAVKTALDPDGLHGRKDLEDLASYRMDELVEAEARADRAEGALARLLAAVDEIEHHCRHRGLNAIGRGKDLHPLFAELWRAAGVARNGL
jgi:hypothetical protein